MVLPESRYSLRLESGERGGETIPIPPGGLTVGRRPDNGLTLDESSVSGHHAELTVDAVGVTLKDLGSTNGTKVSGQRIEETRLAHGDPVVFGSARAVFVDGALADAGPGSDAGEEVKTVATDRVQSSGRKGFLGVVVVLLLLAGGAGGALAFLGGSDDEVSAGATVPVIDVPGNLLADPSFENVEGMLAWSSADAAPEVFYRDVSFRNAGAIGLGVELGSGTWARAESPTFDKLRQRRSYALRASLAAEGGVAACVGFELSASDGSLAAFTCWSRTVSDAPDFEEVELLIPSLPGYDQGRIVVEARGTGDGAASLDDLSLVEQDQIAPSATLVDYTSYLIGEPARTAVVLRNADVVIAGMRVREARAGAEGDSLPRWSAGTITLTATGTGLRFGFSGASSGAELVFAAQPGTGGDGGDPFFATTGADGFHAYTSSFEGVRASGLLLGQGMRLARAGFAGDVTIGGSLAGGALRVAAELRSADAMELQVTFREERKEAAILAAAARDATQDQETGTALQAWSRLLDEFPYEADLVAEAEGERGRLLQNGLEELAALRDEFERARFFGLADLFRQVSDRAANLGGQYAGSEVETEAFALVAAIAVELTGFDTDRNALERAKLQAILGVVEGAEWKGLADHMRGALKDQD